MAKQTPSQYERLAPIANSADHVVGRREIQVLDQLLAKTRDHHAHPNRNLHFDDVVVAHLLAFFNPALRGLRSIQELFEDAKVRKAFRSPRVPKSTLADAQRLFDPELLTPLIAALQERLADLPKAAPLDALTRKLIAVDGSFFAVAPRIAWALYNQNGRNIRKGNVRLHLQFDTQLGIPMQVGLTAGQGSEGQHLRQHLTADCCYVMDRGFQNYQLLADILAAQSDFIVRLRKSATAEVLETRPRTAADQAAGVIADEVVRVGWRSDQTAELPSLRRVIVRAPDRTGEVHDVILLTNLLALSAADVALAYRYRWQVELFFRWLKCMAHFEHFFSESLTGMTLQVYVTIIGTLLIALQIGARPTKYDYALMSSALLGWTSVEHVRAMALKRRDAAARVAQRRVAGAAQKTSH